VNVNELPAQPGLLPVVSVMETTGVTFAVRLIVTELEVAVADDTQVALEVMTQVTACPFVIAELVNVALFVPALVPFTFH
jgi:hypothetical protein